MNSLFYLNVLFIAFTYVICDQRADDVKCVKDGAQSLDDKTDEQIFDVTQQQFSVVQTMYEERVNKASGDGVVCYKQFYGNFSEEMAKLLLGDNEKEQLAKATDAEERTEAAKGIHGMSQLLECDEKWEATNFGQMIKDAECTQKELDLIDGKWAEYKVKLDKLKEGLFVTSNENKVMENITKEVLKMFKSLYAKADACMKAMPTKALECQSVKLLTADIDRQLYLNTIQVQAQIKTLIQARSFFSDMRDGWGNVHDMLGK